jgi:hypothetical protein
MTEDKKRNLRMGRVTAGTFQRKKDDHCKLTDSRDDGRLDIFYELSFCVLFPWRERSIGVETK